MRRTAHDGLDEVSPCAPTEVAIFDGGEVTQQTVRPEDIGLSTIDIKTIAGGDANENAEIIQRVLAGDAIDGTIGTAFGLSVLASGALGNLVSDVCGIGMGTAGATRAQVEGTTLKDTRHLAEDAEREASAAEAPRAWEESRGGGRCR